MRLRLVTPAWGFVAAFVALMCVSLTPAAAQPKANKDKGGDRPAPTSTAAPTKVDGGFGDAKTDGKDAKDPKTGKSKGPKTFDFTALDLNGRMRSPQLLYFLERANEELERASLEKRSFIPHMVRSLEEEAL